jgi:ankyrin repeat protein
LGWRLIGLLFVICVTAAREPIAAEPPSGVTSKPTFEKVGPRVGDQLPNLRLKTLQGEEQRLYDAFNAGPALIVTSSFTCPKSRQRWPEVAALAKQFDTKLNVVIVYVIEAHPQNAVCPYKSVVDVTPENERDGILRNQPKTLEDRLELARDFKRYLRIDVPIYVDTMENVAWKAFGAAPNIAFVVDRDGIVQARQGWFDGPEFAKSMGEIVSRSSEDFVRKQELETLTKKSEQVEKKTRMSASDILRLPWEDKTNGVQDFVKQYPEFVNSVFVNNDRDGRKAHVGTLLTMSIEDKNIGAVKFLLEHGATVGPIGKWIEPAIDNVGPNDEEILVLLLKYQSQVKDAAYLKRSLRKALLERETDVAKALREAGAKLDFYSAIGLGRIDLVEKALGLDPSLALRPDGESHMPLAYAAANDQLEIAKLLIESGAPGDAVESRHELPTLHYAIHPGGAPMVELLLNSGHSADTVYYQGEYHTRESALHVAIRDGDLDILRTLLKHKSDLTITNNRANPPLHDAAELGKADFVAMLIQAGANVNATTKGFSTPCGSGEEERPMYNTPLHFAAACGNPETIQALLKGGAEIDASNADGLTPLMATLKSPRVYLDSHAKNPLANIQALLGAGADVNDTNHQGQTVLDLAEEAVAKAHKFVDPEANNRVFAERTKIVELLRKHGAKRGKENEK